LSNSRSRQKLFVFDPYLETFFMQRILIGLALVAALSACNTQFEQGSVASVPHPGEVILSARTKTLGTGPTSNLSAQAFQSVAQNINDLKAVSDDFTLVTFFGSSTYARGLQPGDIISAPPNQVTPDGFLLKVLAVRDLGSEIQVSTEETDLDEAIEVADSEQEASLQETDLVSVTYADGSTLTGGQVRALQPQATRTLGSFTVPIPSTNLCGTLSGSGSFQATDLKVFLKVKFGFLKVKAIKVGIKGAQSIKLSANGQCTGTINTEQNIARMNFTAKTFWIGPISVTVRPYYDVKLLVNGTIQNRLSFDVTQNMSGPYGAHWQKGIGTSVLSDETTSSMVSPMTPQAIGSLNLRYAIRGEAGLRFWARFLEIPANLASASLFVFAQPYVELNASVQNSNTLYSAFAGADVGLGGRAKIFGKSIGSINFISANVFRQLLFSNDPNVGGSTPAPAPSPTPRPDPRPCPTCQIP
jgi:hypothetical protein